MKVPRTIEWIGDLDGYVSMIDQTLLPGELKMLRVEDVESMREAIRRLSVRGAPAIGIAAAMGVVLGIRHGPDDHRAEFESALTEACARLASARPTAVNLFQALDRMKACAARHASAPIDEIKRRLLEEAKLIRDEDAQLCRAIGRAGAHLIHVGDGVMTHCNAGGLATAEYGTALAVMYTAHEAGRTFRVYANETRPLLQGSRLTAWELQQAGIDVHLACDSMAASLMREGSIKLVVTGADRIAANGDVANKIGTYGLAVLAKAHNIPFYVAAPSTTFDLSIASGAEIPIERRDEDEVRRPMGILIAPDSVTCETPAFDVTPAEFIHGLITEHGIIAPVNQDNIRHVILSDG